MGIWATTLFGSGGAIQWQRWQGTLELLITSSGAFIVVLVPLTLAPVGIRARLARLDARVGPGPVRIRLDSCIPSSS